MVMIINHKNYTMRHATGTVNKYLRLLAQAPPNRDKKYWSWTEEQKELLRINLAKRLINNNKTSKTKAKSKSKQTQYNILTSTSFD